MAYFKVICTKQALIPEFESAARMHEAALNNYLMQPVADGKQRKVEEITSKQVINNGAIVDTTVLCCEDY